jgi:hypothetical protein
MHNTSETQSSNVLRSSLWGVARGVAVHTVIYPLDALKIRAQSSLSSESSFRIASLMWKEGGIKIFYQGLSAQLLKTTIKQIWVWPMILEFPSLLEKMTCSEMEKQMITGTSIAAIDALISTPLERAKIQSALGGKRVFSLKNSYQNGWRGFSTHFTKLLVNWVTFLVAQKILRDRAREKFPQLSLIDLTKIGIQVALIVSIASAPFDMANTLKQGKNLSFRTLVSMHGIRKTYRGWPINALMLTIHNIASVVMIEQMRR